MKQIFLILALTFTFTGLAFGECSDADKKALEAFDRAWGEAGEKGDRTALTAIYADDYTGLPGMQDKTQTIEETMKAFEAEKANPSGDAVAHDNYIISCTPNSATITHRNIVTVKNGAGGKEETFWTRSIHFLEKRAGKWQVVSNAGGGALDEYAILGYLERDWNNADVNRDMNWFERNFAADYSNVSSRDGKIYNKTQELESYKNDKSRTEWNQLSEMNVRIDGNTAIVTGVNHVKGRDDKNQPFDIRVRFTDTFIKRDGRWQVWATQGTRIP